MKQLPFGPRDHICCRSSAWNTTFQKDSARHPAIRYLLLIFVTLPCFPARLLARHTYAARSDQQESKHRILVQHCATNALQTQQTQSLFLLKRASDGVPARFSFSRKKHIEHSSQRTGNEESSISDQKEYSAIHVPHVALHALIRRSAYFERCHSSERR